MNSRALIISNDGRNLVRRHISTFQAFNVFPLVDRQFHERNGGRHLNVINCISIVCPELGGFFSVVDVERDDSCIHFFVTSVKPSDTTTFLPFSYRQRRRQELCLTSSDVDEVLHDTELCQKMAFLLVEQ